MFLRLAVLFLLVAAQDVAQPSQDTIPSKSPPTVQSYSQPAGDGAERFESIFDGG